MTGDEAQLLHLLNASVGPRQGLVNDSTKEVVEDLMALDKPLKSNMESLIHAPLSEMHDSTVTQLSSSVQVPFSYYPFADLACLGALPLSDVAFLESQGSLHLPTRILLDALMHHDFLHIHPVLPLIHEGDFWEVYQQRVGDSSPPRISLPVLHAMLFASCTFVCDATVRRLGYSDVRSMRVSFFRRAELLLNFRAHLSLSPQRRQPFSHFHPCPRGRKSIRRGLQALSKMLGLPTPTSTLRHPNQSILHRNA